MTTLPMEKTDRKQRLFDPYKVLLHNDDVNEQGHVVQSLLKAVPQLPTSQATEIMLEADNQGVAIVILCPLEHAEMYRDRLRSFGLVSSIEKDF